MEIFRSVISFIIFILLILWVNSVVTSQQFPEPPTPPGVDALYQEYEDQSGYRFIDKGW